MMNIRSPIQDGATGFIVNYTQGSIMSISSVSSDNSSFYNSVVQPIKNVVSEVGDEIGDAYDATADAVSSAAHAVADSVSSGVKAIGNIIDTSA